MATSKITYWLFYRSATCSDKSVVCVNTAFANARDHYLNEPFNSKIKKNSNI